jgi:hypothetical protein
MRRSVIAASVALLVGAAAIVVGTTASPFGGTAQGAIAYNRATTTCGAPYDNRAFPSGFIFQVDPFKSYGVFPSAHQHAWYSRHDISSTMSAKIPLNSAHFDDPGYQAPAFDNCDFYTEWNIQEFPAPLWNGQPISPGPLRNTVQAPVGVHVEPEPFGEIALVGNPSAQSEAQMDPNVSFTCGDIDTTYTRPQDCTNVPGGYVTAQIKFPDCWDGTQGYDPATHTYPGFDAPNGIGIDQRHFSYSVNGKCPDGMTPCVPALRMEQLVSQQTFLMPDGTRMRNPYNADGTLGLSFASGPYYTYHSGYANSSGTVIRNAVVQQCLNNSIANACPPGTYVGTAVRSHQLD